MPKKSRRIREEGEGRNDNGHSSPTIPHLTDERELKRQKRKQSNRESALRSRLRKQAEFDGLQAQLETLSSENRALRDKLQTLPEKYVKLTSENNSHKVCQNVDKLQRGPDECEKLTSENNAFQEKDSAAAYARYPLRRASTVSQKCDCLRVPKRINRNENLSDSNEESADWSIPTTKIVPITEFYSSQLPPHGQSSEESNPAPSLEHLDSAIENCLPIRAVPPACTVSTTVWEAEVEFTDVEDSLDESRYLERSLSLNLSEMGELLDDDSSSQNEVDFPGLYHPLVTVEGYRVKAEMAPTLRLVLAKHGDIAANSSLKTLQSRSTFLEFICGIIQELQVLVFTEVTLAELESMRAVVVDLEHVSIDVSWLGKKLDDIIEAKQLVKQSSSLKKARNENERGIEEIENENETIKEKLRVNHEKLSAMKAGATPIYRTISEAKEKVKCFYKRSLVEGLL